MSTRFPLGTLLLDRYQIIEVRRGGMGEVAICQDAQLTATPLVAFKSIASELLHDGHFNARFQQEAEAWSLVGRGGLGFVLPLEEVIIVDGALLLKMPYCSRGGLDSRLRQGPLSREEAVECATELLIGLHALNVDMGLVHRDLKPSNILFDDDGRVQISDFGLAKFIERRDESFLGAATQSGGTEFGEFVGTPAYAAPEQLRGVQPIDWRADTWAFGIVVFEMFTGRRPFPDEDAAAHLKTILTVRPAGLDKLANVATSLIANIVKKCLERDPSRRFRTFADLIRAWDDAIRTPDSPAVGLFSRDLRVSLPIGSLAEAPWTGLFFPKRIPNRHQLLTWDLSAIAGTARARDYYRLDKFEESIAAAEKTLGIIEEPDSIISRLLAGVLTEKSSFIRSNSQTRVEPSCDTALDAMHWLLRSLVALVEAKPNERGWLDYLGRVSPRVAASELRDAESRLLATQGLLLTGQFTEGVRIARELLAAEPLNVRMGWVAFQALRRANSVAEARSLAKKLTREYAMLGGKEHYCYAVRLAYAAEDWEAVADMSSEAARLAPSDFEVIGCIASTLLILSRPEDARFYYERMRALYPDAPHTLYIAKMLNAHQ